MNKLQVLACSILVSSALAACGDAGQHSDEPPATVAAVQAPAPAAPSAAPSAALDAIEPAAVAAMADTSANCPVLPAESGLAWTHQPGPDFIVCYASPPGSEESAFGIYLGNHPSFDPAKGVAIGKGTIAGGEITWYQQEKGDDGAALARQTLVVLDAQRGAFAHVWVTAVNQKELDDRLSILDRISFPE